MPDPKSETFERDRRFLELKLYLEIYKHHFDLILKGLAIYLAIIGATAGYIYSDKATTSSQAALSVFTAVVSGLAIAGCEVGRRWMIAIERIVNEISEELSTKRFPISGAKGTLLMIMLGAVVILALSLFNLKLVLP